MSFGLITVTLFCRFSSYPHSCLVDCELISCWDCADRFQLFLRSCLGSKDHFGLVFRYSPELRRAEQLHAYFLGSHSDFRLNIDGLWPNSTDDNLDNVHAGWSLLDRVVLGV